MAISDGMKVNLLDREGVQLAYVDAGPRKSANPPVVLIHGWIGDHTALLPQIEHFAKTQRVVAIHLRGHGDSDAPQQEYTMAGFADDVAWQCEQLGLDKPVVVGHSLGGAVALELAGRHPDLPSGIVIIDSLLFPRPIGGAEVMEAIAQLTGPNYRAAARAQAAEIYLNHVDIDDPDRKERLLNLLYKAHEKTPPHAAVSTMANVFNGYDSTPAAKACTAPVVYLDAGVPLIEQLRDLDRFKAVCPQLVIAKTFGAGHFAPLEVPDQVNAMIARFIAVGIDRHVYAEASAR